MLTIELRIAMDNIDLFTFLIYVLSGVWFGVAPNSRINRTHGLEYVLKKM